MAKLIAILIFISSAFGFYRDFDVIIKGDDSVLSVDDFIGIKKCDDCFIFNIVSFNQCKVKDRGFVLIFGGIQGDEPGGFHAAALLADEYEFYDKVMIVPNLAYESILLRGRGMYGDLNRKFSTLDEKDPDYKRIQKIKNLILNNDIDFIINLHDGSGFYSKKNINKNQNPDKWGNACIIDQASGDFKNGNLYYFASKAKENINKHLLKPHHRYDIKNTNTKDGDEEMLKALTYFAITHKKAAVANEASKDLPTHERVYYHLLAIEGYLDALGIRYKRNFKLNALNVYHKINKNYTININDMFVFPINDLRANLNYIPFDNKYLKNGFANIISDSPLVALYRQDDTPKNQLLLQYGNRLKTTFNTFDIKYANHFSSFDMVIDNQKVKIEKSGIYKAKKDFLIEPKAGLRFNVIGFSKNGVLDESGIKISKNQILPRFSIDKKGKIFRVELYENKNNEEIFAGMILVEF